MTLTMRLANGTERRKTLRDSKKAYVTYVSYFPPPWSEIGLGKIKGISYPAGMKSIKYFTPAARRI